MFSVRCPGPPGSCSPVRTLCVWCCVYGVLGLLAPVHRCARSVCGVACTASWASWLLFTGVHPLCVVLRVRCPGPPGYCSPVCTLCVWCCVYGVLGLLAPVHRCARSVCGVACTGVLGLLAPVHRCARSVLWCVCGVACTCTVSWASWLLFTGPLCVWCCVYGVLGLLTPVHRCARSVCGVVCTVSWAPWLLFTGVHALRVVLCVRRPGLLAPVHRCARFVCGVACTVFWASWHTQNSTPSEHTGEQEPGAPGHRTRVRCGPGRRTRETTHRAGTPVNRSQEAQDIAHAKQHAERAHR